MEPTLIYNDYYNENYIISEITGLLQIVKVDIIEKNGSYYVDYQLKHFEKNTFNSYSSSFTREEVLEDVLKGILNKIEKGHFKHYSVWVKKNKFYEIH